MRAPLPRGHRATNPSRQGAGGPHVQPLRQLRRECAGPGINLRRNAHPRRANTCHAGSQRSPAAREPCRPTSDLSDTPPARPGTPVTEPHHYRSSAIGADPSHQRQHPPTPHPHPRDTPTPATTTPTPTTTCTAPTPPPTDAPSGTMTDAQKTTLATMMEEQQLANDLYLDLRQHVRDIGVRLHQQRGRLAAD